jgi:opacity protein-like surface antigen
MKQTAKLAMLAIALFVGMNGTALANGTDRPKSGPATAAPAAMTQPAATVAEPVSNTGPYLRGAGGAALSGESTIKTGYVINGALGYNFDPYRVEGAFGYQRHGLSDVSGHVYYWTFMANAYYDLEDLSGFRPYLTAGLGAANGHWSVTNDSNTNFAWQIGAGLGVNISDNTMFDLGYSYFKPEGNNTSFNSHNFQAGIRYQF